MEKEQMRVSVIVPIYNIRNYVSRCIDSIVSQTYRNLEIILVDDGSTDGSGAICDKYASSDKRIRVFHKENGGLSDARNYALDRASGEIISFVDGDDYIHAQMMECMIDTYRRTGAKVVACRFERSDESVMKKMYDSDNLIAEIITGTEAIKDLEKPDVVAWNKIYDRELFDGIRYPVGKYHEDEYVIHKIFHKCEKVAVLQEKFYFYVTRENSIMDDMTPKRVYDALEGLESRCDYCDKSGWDEALPSAIERYSEYCISYYMQIREGKYPKLDVTMADLLLKKERDMIGKFENVPIDEKYRRFSYAPKKYVDLENKRRHKKEKQDALLKYPRKIYRMFKRIVKTGDTSH